jgi:hypothetical protein
MSTSERDTFERELGALLEQDAPKADPVFEAELRGRVHAGFPRERRRLPALRPLPAFGALVSVVVAATVAVSLLSDDGTKRQTTGTAGAERSVPRVQALSGGGSGPDRRVERSAAMTLAAPADELDDVSDGVARVTDRFGGYVLSSSVTTGADTAGGQFELRIPVDRLRPALTALAELADVRSRTEAGQDVTRRYVSIRDRLQAMRAERRSLLRRLERADSDAEAERLRRRLDSNALQIRLARGQLRDLRQSTNYARVTIDLEPRDGDSGAGGGSSTDDALDDAVDSLLGSVNLVIRILGVALPLGIVGAGLWVAGRAVRRRRREAALA